MTLDQPCPIDFDSDDPRCIWVTGREAGLRLDELQTIIWERMAAAPAAPVKVAHDTLLNHAGMANTADVRAVLKALGMPDA